MSTESMKLIRCLALCLLLSGCFPIQQWQRSLACSESRNAETLPVPGQVAVIDVAFDILVAGEVVRFEESAVCEYQGSMCPAGKLYEVWYGNQSLDYRIEISEEETLGFWPHGFCIQIDDFKKKCAAGTCSPEDSFEFTLQLSSERESVRREECELTHAGKPTDSVDEFVKCAFPGVDSVTFSGLRSYGYDIRNERIEILNAGYPLSPGL